MNPYADRSIEDADIEINSLYDDLESARAEIQRLITASAIENESWKNMCDEFMRLVDENLRLATELGEANRELARIDIETGAVVDIDRHRRIASLVSSAMKWTKVASLIERLRDATFGAANFRLREEEIADAVDAILEAVPAAPIRIPNSPVYTPIEKARE